MSKFIKKTNRRIGASPGTLIHIGDTHCKETQITQIRYNKDMLEQLELKKTEDIIPHFETSDITWVNVSGIHDVGVIERIGRRFKLHPLTLEDVLNTMQRPKADDYGDYIFLQLKMLYYDEKDSDIKAQQVSLIMGENYIVSFQEFDSMVFDNVIVRLDNEKSNIRKFGADYLGYALIDAVVDSYFAVLEKVGDITDEIEEQLMNEPGKEILQRVYHIKREMMFLRNSLWPLREVINSLIRGESELIKETTIIYLRDVYDHTIQVIDTVEVYQEISANMLDTYLSSISNKTNDVMKILTVFSTIFIPLTFLAGIYGMNFKNIPELEWRFGYHMFWGICIIIIIGMFVQFKKKRWI